MESIVRQMKLDVEELKLQFTDILKEEVRYAVVKLKSKNGSKSDNTSASPVGKVVSKAKGSFKKDAETGGDNMTTRQSKRISERSGTKTVNKNIDINATYTRTLSPSDDEYVAEEISEESESESEEKTEKGKSRHCTKSYKCKFCRKKFVNVMFLKQHIVVHKTVLSQTLFDCPICDKRFVTQHGLHIHMSWHINSKGDKTCRDCHQEFDNLQLLAAHHQKFHKRTSKYVERTKEQEKRHSKISKTYKCDVCSTTFSHEKLFKAHVQTHENQQLLFSCPVCNNTYGSVYGLFTHQSYHPATGKYKCSNCNESFESLYSFNIHHYEKHVAASEQALEILKNAMQSKMKTSNRKRQVNYTCKHCSQTFTNIRPYKEHMLNHKFESKMGNLTPLHECSCPICDTICNNVDILFEHLKTHSAVNDFNCRICNDNFVDLSILTVHFHKEHCKSSEKLNRYIEMRFMGEYCIQVGDMMVNKCDHCPEEFRDITLFNKHLMAHEDELAKQSVEFSCPVCAAKYHSLSGLFVHQIWHSDKSFSCANCSLSMDSLDSLTLHHHKSHTKSSAQLLNLIECSVERRKADLKRQPHIYTCKYCLLHFSQLDLYNDHLRNHSINPSIDGTNKKAKKINQLETKGKKTRKNKRKETLDIEEAIAESLSDDDELYECPVCGEDFEKRQGLQTHLNHHTGSEVAAAKEKIKQKTGKAAAEVKLKGACNSARIYKCVVCSETFFRIFKYRKHIIENHNDNKELREKDCFNCSFCGESFNFKGKLNIHLRTLHDVFVQCSLCNENCKTKEIFIQHVSDKHCDNNSEKYLSFSEGFMCKLCGVAVNTQGKIVHHYMTHHTEKSIKCDVCDKKFASGTDLTRHQKQVHVNENYCCDECGRQLKTKRLWQAHLRTHSKSKVRVQCKDCSKTFANQVIYRNHYVAHHKKETPYQCKKCGQSFNFGSTLHIHQILTCEPEKAKKATCSICFMVFDNYIVRGYHKANMHKYGNLEENVCHLCKKRFENSASLFHHNQYYHTKGKGQLIDDKVNCNVCGVARSSLKCLFEHVMTHEQPLFECLVCGEKFRQKGGFYQHRKIRHKDRKKEEIKVKTDHAALKLLKEKFRKDYATSTMINAPMVPNIVEKSTVTQAINNVVAPEMREHVVSESPPMMPMQSNALGEAPEPLSDAEDYFDVPDGLIDNDSNHEINSLMESSITADQGKESETQNYIDFSRANVPEQSLTGIFNSIPSNENGEELGNPIDATVNVSSSTNEVPFCNDTDNISNVLEPPVMNYPTSPQMPAIEYYFDEDDDHLEVNVKDIKPLIFTSKKFPLDPFPVQLIVKLRKLEEYRCDICDQIYFTKIQYRSHLTSRDHRTAKRQKGPVKDEKFIDNGNRKSRRKANNSKHRKKKSIKIENERGRPNTNKVRRKVNKPGKKCPICEEVFYTEAKYRAHKISHRDHQCTICEDSFIFEYLLVLHYFTMHDGANLTQCSKCNKKFAYPKSLEHHLQRKHKGRRVRKPHGYPCDHCDATFVLLKLYKEHLFIHLNEKFPCTLCEEQVETVNDLRDHYNESHDGNMPFKCDDCSKSLACRFDLIHHQKCVHSLKFTASELTMDPKDNCYGCDYCGKRFRERATFRRHLRSHNDPSVSHFCPHCRKEFLKFSNYEEHVRIHTGERPYSCTDCAKNFISQSTLNKHVRTFHLNKSLCCEFCGKEFKNISSFKVHVRTHTGERPFACDKCPEDNRLSFISTTALRVHVDTVHLNLPAVPTFACEVCGKLIRGQHGIKVHMRYHTGEKPHSCKMCDKSYFVSTDLKRHVDAIHLKVSGASKEFVCSVCSEEFWTQGALDKHFLMHDPSRPFACDQCSCRFNFHSNMVFHKKNVHLKMGIVYWSNRKQRKRVKHKRPKPSQE